ncbi:mannosyl-3-phosphoglycerate phosphatase [Amphritea atlantica]|uniref:Mannosyl-3-phosphoglycerate phosphatase n=1 Tax=Amphritea atlantica TaxID=355243 RepID=A0A1H9GU89_9GAMM|nr:HAD-IIB family hydrolase [Amphritea atlantica]SEQ53599.1 mannosyl-3-phosphoglycerate phosphatase [Amphritea atlantica]
MTQKILIFTDLDGSLLDHFSYSFSPAQPLLSLFNEIGVPVIPVTSKTRAELAVLRCELDNHDPFVVENGAAVFIPENYFSSPPAGCEVIDGFYRYQFSKPREYWTDLLAQQEAEFGGEFETFTHLGVEGIRASTGLTESAAQQASKREFSEPVLWLGLDERKLRFIETLREAGATVLQGGRFLHVTGAGNKGKALQWLSEQYRAEYPDSALLTIAAGDSDNDVDMLQVADCAVVVRSPVHSPPEVPHQHLYLSRQTGPQGWVEGVNWFLGAADRPETIDSIEYLRTKLRSRCYG